jgi:hypothetical protein
MPSVARLVTTSRACTSITTRALNVALSHGSQHNLTDLIEYVGNVIELECSSICVFIVPIRSSTELFSAEVLVVIAVWLRMDRLLECSLQ